MKFAAREERRKQALMGDQTAVMHEALKRIPFNELEDALNTYKKVGLLALIKGVEIIDAEHMSHNPDWDHNVGQKLKIRFKDDTVLQGEKDALSPLGITRGEAE